MKKTAAAAAAALTSSSAATLAPLFRAYADLWQCMATSCAPQYRADVAARRDAGRDGDAKDHARLANRKCVSKHCGVALRATLLALLARLEAELAEHTGPPLRGLEQSVADLRALAAERGGPAAAAGRVASLYANLSMGTLVTV